MSNGQKGSCFIPRGILCFLIKLQAENIYMYIDEQYLRFIMQMGYSGCFGATSDNTMDSFVV